MANEFAPVLATLDQAFRSVQSELRQLRGRWPLDADRLSYLEAATCDLREQATCLLALMNERGAPPTLVDATQGLFASFRMSEAVIAAILRACQE